MDRTRVSLTSLDRLIDEAGITTFLVDASGVIYNETRFIDGIGDTISRLQEVGDVFVVTNNSYEFPTDISAHFREAGIRIDPARIISSGHGAKFDTTIRPNMVGKRVFVFGSSGSRQYLKDAGAEVVLAPQEANSIAMMASYATEAENMEQLGRLTKHLLAKPEIPVFCCNPDRIIRDQHGGTRYVAGHYADLLAADISQEIYWFGKPLDNFSNMLGTILSEQFGVVLDERVCMFDDNPENVVNISGVLGILGCCVTGTGIAGEWDLGVVSEGNPGLRFLERLGF